jgi:hypothetical protein
MFLRRSSARGAGLSGDFALALAQRRSTAISLLAMILNSAAAFAIASVGLYASTVPCRRAVPASL